MPPSFPPGNPFSCFRLVFLIAVFLSAFLPASSFAAETVVAVPLSADDISVMQDEIESQGLGFKVAPNWITRLPAAERQKLLSRHPSAFPARVARSFAAGPLPKKTAASLPPAFDWRRVDGHSYIGPVRNQGSCGTCYAFAACAALEGALDIATNRYDDRCLDLSEACLAFCLDRYYDGFSGCEGSSYDYEELDALSDLGTCREEFYPYEGIDYGCPVVSGSVPRYRCSAWYRLPCGDVNAIKNAILRYGVVVAAVWADNRFYAYASGIYRNDSSDCDASPCYYAPTNHCIALVGWDDNGGDGYWILRNSWGREWGENGYMRIAYDAAHVSCAACYLVVSGISGCKWNDYNINGIRDADEPGLSHWKIFLDLNRNGTADPDEPVAVTDVNGDYMFTGLAPGSYSVVEELQPGWQQTRPGSRAAPGSCQVTLAEGEMVRNVNFGNFGPDRSGNVRLKFRCGPDPGDLCYGSYATSIAEVYAASEDGDEIQVQIGNYLEDLDFDQPQSIRLEGGYSAGFTEKTGFTSLVGSLTVSSGRVTVERLVIQ